MEAGLDSISSVELRNSVSSKFGLELPATVTFDYPSIEALAEFVAASVAPRQQSTVDLATAGEVGQPPRLERPLISTLAPHGTWV